MFHARGDHRQSVVIGKDTTPLRLQIRDGDGRPVTSGRDGRCFARPDATPAVAMRPVRCGRSRGEVMISASTTSIGQRHQAGRPDGTVSGRGRNRGARESTDRTSCPGNGRPTTIPQARDGAPRESIAPPAPRATGPPSSGGACGLVRRGGRLILVRRWRRGVIPCRHPAGDDPADAGTWRSPAQGRPG